MFLNRNKRINDFWTWFIDNKDVYERTDVNFDNLHEFYDDSATQELLSKIQKIDKGIHVAYTGVDENNPTRKLIISANGNIKKFSIVEKIVAMSRPIARWEIMAFRPRIKDPDLTVHFNSYEYMKVDEMFFDHETINNKIQINVYGIGLEKYDIDSVHEAGMIFMQYVLGEYNAIMKVHRFSFYGLIAINDYSDVQPLTELHKFVETLPNKR